MLKFVFVILVGSYVKFYFYNYFCPHLYWCICQYLWWSDPFLEFYKQTENVWQLAHRTEVHVFPTVTSFEMIV